MKNLDNYYSEWTETGEGCFMTTHLEDSLDNRTLEEYDSGYEDELVCVFQHKTEFYSVVFGKSASENKINGEVSWVDEVAMIVVKV